jgi:cell division septum initiation protein DivIVA
LAVVSEPAKMFSRRFMGYDLAAVDAHIEMLTTKQRLLLDDVESLRARLRESGEEAAALRKEVGVLTDSSPAPHAVQQRMAKMLRRAVDEVSEMQAEARAEVDAMMAAAEAEVQAEQRKHEGVLADLVAQREALETDYADTKEKLEAELTRLRADAQREREQLLADVKQQADEYREQARRAVDEATERRIQVLEQLMGVYRDLDGIPAALESAYHELKNPADEKISAG